MYPTTPSELKTLLSLIRKVWQPIKKIAVMVRTDKITSKKLDNQMAKYDAATVELSAYLDAE